MGYNSKKIQKDEKLTYRVEASVREHVRKAGIKDAIVFLEEGFVNAIEDAHKENLSLRKFFMRSYRQPKDYLLHFRYRFGKNSREHLYRKKGDTNG